MGRGRVVSAEVGGMVEAQCDFLHNSEIVMNKEERRGRRGGSQKFFSGKI